MSDKISEWLHGLGLEQYTDSFKQNAIEPHILPDLCEDDLKELGVGALGHRKILLREIAALQAERASCDSGIDISAKTSTAVPDEDASAWSRTPGERKPVTMLFADIVGSTALTEKLDPEEAHELLYRAAQRMCELAEQFQGTVCRFMGDGIMAMFGAPIASERHALEACQAALAMQQWIAAYADELEAGHNARIQIRVGLHSGEVVVLEVGDDPERPEYDASGPTVPIAARMEENAKAGAILMTSTTRTLAGDLIEADEHAAVSVKGISDPVRVFELRKIRAGDSSAVFGMHAPFVGRRAELAQFRGLLGECLESHHGQTIYLRGEPGIGKTRLVEEMTLHARQQGFELHKALVLDFGVGKGQEAVPALVRSLLGIKQGSGKVKREKKVERAETSGLVDTEQRVYLNDLLDLNQPLELRTLYDAMEVNTRIDGKHRVVADILARRAAQNPVLLVIESLHWAGGDELDYLVTLTETVAEHRVLMLLTSRMEGDPIDTNWRARTSEHPVVTWDLGPLRTEECLEMVTSIGGVDQEFARFCVARAEGNPLFLEQLLLGGEKVSSESIPDSIKSLVLSRIDHLSRQNKLALRAASVLGQRFDHDGLCFLLDNDKYEIQGLVEHHLLRPEGAQYMFTHALIQGGAYTSLLKSQRADLHRRAAEWFAERDSVLHAEHLDRAGDDAAANAYLRAAQLQSDLYRPERALQLTHRGIEIAPPPEQFALACLEGELLRIIGDIPESIEAYRQAAEAAGGEIGRCQAWIGMAEGLSHSGAHEELIELLDNAEEIAQEHNLVLELARIYLIRGSVLFFRGEIDACLEAGKSSLTYARDAGSAEVEAQALSGLGNAEYNRGRFISAKRYFDFCLELARERGFGRIIAANLSHRGYVTYWQNDINATRGDYVEAVEQARKTSDQRAEMLALIIGGSFWAGVGNLSEGEQWLDRALAITRRSGARIFEGVCSYLLGRFALLRGDREQARKLVKAGVEVLTQSESGMTFGGPIALGVLALAAETPEQSRETLERAEALLDAGSVGHNYLNFYEDAMEVSLHIQAWEEVDRYAEALENYTLAEPLPRSDFIIARGRALAAHGRGERGDAARSELQRLRDEAEAIGIAASVPALEQALGEFS